MTPTISERGRLMPASPIRRLAGACRDAERRGVKVYKLNIGQPDVPTPPQAIEALKHIDRRVLEYSPSEGLEGLRVKMAEYYRSCGLDITPEEIIITSGGSEAVLFAFMACLDPGDELILPEPAYANYMGFARSAGIVIRPVTASIESGFALPGIEEFEKLIGPRTKAIMICNPNNPTGYTYTAAELNAIASLAERRGLFLFSDEVYREFCYTGEPFVSVMSLPQVRENAVLIDSVSKRYNECGIRIGALVCRDPKVRECVVKFCQARLSPPLLGQIVAEASVDTPQSYMDKVHDEYESRRDLLLAKLNAIPGVFAPMPKGAFYAIAALPVKDADHFCQWMLESFSDEGRTVFMAPASGFYTNPALGRNQVRIAYVHDRHYLSEAMDVLESGLKTYRNLYPSE